MGTKVVNADVVFFFFVFFFIGGGGREPHPHKRYRFLARSPACSTLCIAKGRNWYTLAPVFYSPCWIVAVAWVFVCLGVVYMVGDWLLW